MPVTGFWKSFELVFCKSPVFLLVLSMEPHTAHSSVQMGEWMQRGEEDSDARWSGEAEHGTS